MEMMVKREFCHKWTYDNNARPRLRKCSMCEKVEQEAALFEWKKVKKKMWGY